VQSSPLVDSDRVTLGQLHMTFVDPRPVEQEASASPLGTVRLNPSQMAKMHLSAFDPLPTEPVASLLSKAPVPSRPMPPSTPPSAYSTAKNPGEGEEQETTPEFIVTHTTTAADNPAPAFLRPWLPPLPDDAEPILLGGAPERGDFVTRLIAYLIDWVPLVALQVLFYVLSFLVGLVTANGLVLGCLVLIPSMVLSMAYGLVFLPWCWSTFGATPGKKIMKLRIVPEDDPTGRIDFKTAFLRLIGHICNFGFGYLLIFGSERKAIQDLVSKSICIKVDR